MSAPLLEAVAAAPDERMILSAQSQTTGPVVYSTVFVSESVTIDDGKVYGKA